MSCTPAGRHPERQGLAADSLQVTVKVPGMMTQGEEEIKQGGGQTTRAR